MLRRSVVAAISATQLRLGAEQLEENLPTSSARKRKGFHRGLNQRLVSKAETLEWRAMRRWELEAAEEWDDFEAFRALPKPKKLFGNEACHAVWPYAVLLERQTQIHPLTKSVYVYYPQHSLTPAGEALRLAARQFCWEHLVPITFHNSQCYVEAELLVEYSDNPWIVVNCLDGNSRIIPITEKLLGDTSSTNSCLERHASTLLSEVCRIAGELGDAAKRTPQLMRELHDRPLQNQFVRVDYQWFGDTPEERAQHTVQWTREDYAVQPRVAARHVRAFQWANISGWAPVAPWMKNAVKKESRRLMTGAKGDWYNMQSFHLSQRNLPTYSPKAGSIPKQ